jgi:hypothetical protein
MYLASCWVGANVYIHTHAKPVRVPCLAADELSEFPPSYGSSSSAMRAAGIRARPRPEARRVCPTVALSSRRPTGRRGKPRLDVHLCFMRLWGWVPVAQVPVVVVGSSMLM